MKAIACVSWNILAQRYASSPCDDWETRLIKIFFRLQDENDTIVCLQEVELERFRSDFLYLCRKCGYNYVIHEVNKKRTNPIGKKDLNATAYGAKDAPEAGASFAPWVDDGSPSMRVAGQGQRSRDQRHIQTKIYF